VLSQVAHLIAGYQKRHSGQGVALLKLLAERNHRWWLSANKLMADLCGLRWSPVIQR
jgi:hypothetical protein